MPPNPEIIRKLVADNPKYKPGPLVDDPGWILQKPIVRAVRLVLEYGVGVAPALVNSRLPETLKGGTYIRAKEALLAGREVGANGRPKFYDVKLTEHCIEFVRKQNAIGNYVSKARLRDEVCSSFAPTLGSFFVRSCGF